MTDVRVLESRVPGGMPERPGSTSTDGMNGPRKLHVESYGCQMNVYDSHRMADLLAPRGFVESAAEDADLVILNTCHIREKAAEKVYSELGRIRKLKKAAARDGRRIVIAVAASSGKGPLFTLEERVALVKDAIGGDPRVEVRSFDGLLVDYVERRQAQVIVRGLRAVSDFEFEFQMALMNQHLRPAIETVFMMPAEKYTYLSSRLIKEVFSLGGSIAGLVPPVVETRLRARLTKKTTSQQGA